MVLIILVCGIGMNRLAARGGSLAYAAAGFAGFGGMVLESAMMLHYQTQSGALYQNMGILFMAFMLGMSAGAAGNAEPDEPFQGPIRFPVRGRRCCFFCRLRYVWDGWVCNI